MSRTPDRSEFANGERAPDSARLGAAQDEEWRYEMCALRASTSLTVTLLIGALCDGSDKKTL